MPDRELLLFKKIQVGDIVYEKANRTHWFFKILSKDNGILAYSYNKNEKAIYTKLKPTSSLRAYDWDDWLTRNTNFKFILYYDATGRKTPRWRV